MHEPEWTERIFHTMSIEMQPPSGPGCLICGNTPKSEGTPPRVLPMAVAVGADVNWGDPVEICVDCIGVMADHIGRVAQDKHTKLMQEHEELRQQYGALETRHADQTERISRLLEGKKAEKEQRAALKENAA